MDRLPDPPANHHRLPVTGDPKDPAPADVLTSGGEPPAGPTLSEAQRAAAFSSGREPIDRVAALRAGSVPVPRKFVLWAIVGFAVLGLGGVATEHFIGNAGVESAITTPPATLAGTASGPPSTPPAPTGPSVGATPVAVIGLRHLGLAPAPALSLTDQHGDPWTLTRTRGKVVVVSFLNAECNDLCPVLGQEITQADHLLGPRSTAVEFVVVNTDPLETTLAVTPPALTRTGLDGLGNVTFLTGPLGSLSRSWNAYGVTVAVSTTTRLASHTNVMYFIDPRGRLALLATPFGNEDSFGAYSLDPGTIHTFAQGVAAAAAGLLPRRP